MRDLILQALNSQPGGAVEYFKRMAEEHPAAFISLLAKLIPKEVSRRTEEAPPVHLTVAEAVQARRTR